MRRRRSRNRRRTSIRRRRRNSWRNNKVAHRRAALKGWRKRGRKGGRKGGRKTRRRAKNASFRYRKGGRRRRARNRRRRSYNASGTLSLRRPIGTMTAGFQPKVLTKAAVITGGALGNAWLSGTLSGFLPSMLQTGPGSYVVGLASAGLMGAGVGMVSPKMAGDVFFGGVLEVVTRAVKEYVLPALPGMSGMGEFLTREDAATARPLGDYLTPQNAQTAQSLGYVGDYYGDETVADELVA